MTTRHCRRLPALVAAAGVLWASLGAVAADKPAKPDPADPLKETPQQRDERMAWWRQARFGMFIHWGLYAVPAGVWKGKKIGGIGEWIMSRAKIPVGEYEKLAGQFNPVKFDADAWADLAKRAGMKYMVITSKHHDGFCLWDSKLGDYDIMATPFKRDILKELADACGKHDVRFCFYHSIMDWHHPAQKADFPTYHRYLTGQVRELLTGYGPIGVMWFDGEWIRQWDRQKGRELAALCRSIQPKLVINNRVGKRKREDGDFGTPEQKIPPRGIPGHDWETCMTMNGTWGFKTHDHNWKSTTDLLRKLVDIASKGGNFLLNVGPTAEGLIPKPSIQRLEEMGRWLDVNGESIYATGPSPFKRLPWGRCTTKLAGKSAGAPNRLYLHVFNWPADGKLLVPGLAGKASRACLLADKKRSPLKTHAGQSGLIVELPGKAPDPIDSVVVLDLPGKVEIAAYTIRAAADGSYSLHAADAQTHGRTARFEGDKNSIGFWTNPKDWVSWQFELAAAGTFRVEITYACETGSGESTYEIVAGDKKLEGRVKETGAWTKFSTDKLGTIKLTNAGRTTLAVKPKTKPHLAVMNLRTLRLVPADK